MGKDITTERVPLGDELRIEAGLVAGRRGELYNLAADKILRLRGALWHAVYRNHSHSPNSCSICSYIDEELNAYARGE